ncbi:MAG: hypothetical protein ACOCY0_05835 [Roseicyclus sp.]
MTDDDDAPRPDRAELERQANECADALVAILAAWRDGTGFDDAAILAGANAGLAVFAAMVLGPDEAAAQQRRAAEAIEDVSPMLAAAVLHDTPPAGEA